MLWFVFTGCASPPPEVGWDEPPEPWHDLGPLEVESFRSLIQTPLPGVVGPQKLVVFPSHPLTVVLANDGLYMLDQRYDLDKQVRCLNTSDFLKFDDDPSRQGDCPLGSVELRRGYFAPEGGIADVAIDATERTVWAISLQGTLYSAGFDVLAGNPLDHLRFKASGTVAIKNKAGVSIAASGGTVFVADGDRLVEISGTSTTSTSAPAPMTGLLWTDELWGFTETGLLRGDEVVDLAGLPGGAVDDGAGGLWVTVPQRETLVHVGADLSTTDQPIEGLLGPLALDSVTGRLVLVVQGAVVARATDATLEILSDLALVDLAQGPAHEIIALADEGVQVFADQTPLLDHRPALQVWTAAMAENPRQDPDEVDCANGANPLIDIIPRSVGNMRWLASTPMPVALGITPALAQKAQQCGMSAPYPLLWQDEQVEVGALFHGTPEPCGGDEDCYVTALEDELAAIRGLGANVNWSGGLTNHWDEGLDWVSGVGAAQAPTTIMFFGLGVLPEITLDDPRAKESYPVDATTPLVPFELDSADLTPGDATTLLPGNTVSGFSLAGCGSLFVAECKQLDLGGRAVFDVADLKVLDLLIHRAMATRPDDVSTWYFHLPAIGLYDYTEGCSVDDDGFWSGGVECQAGILQDWMLAVHQRFVLNGAVAWSLPSQVP